MSTTTVCRVGLQSCLEPKLVEPLTLHLTLASPKPNSPQHIIEVGDAPPLSDIESDNEELEVHEHIENINNNSDTSTKKNSTSNGDFGGWSFIESLTKEANEDKKTPYVHPLDKRSMSTLTNKSLELCTESLGSETGSDIGDENDLYSSSSSDSESRKFPIRERSRFSRLLHKKAIRRSFPPPLTSISGSDYVQFTPHREGGRLVIKAVTIATAPTCFQAERTNGRLRLHFKTSYNSCSSSEEDTDDDEQQDKEDQEQDHHVTCLNENLNGNSTTCNVEDEMAIVKYQRPCSWYKDSTTGHGNKRFINWKPFLGVAM
ncbi:hypothetical protein AQUCO_01700431v1 [Aquilegia coerulea]|uniref:FAF domain-containing protein n=1 Tax=Aquilegia coerulea TaxID=218851 RepID=A0A2G5DMU4_AQUCA|nr:hypothetical protein AQUCO_01700431v1 [Aquilegia coerulea]